MSLQLTRRVKNSLHLFGDLHYSPPIKGGVMKPFSFLITILLISSSLAFGSAVDHFCQAFDKRKTNDYVELAKMGEETLKNPSLSDKDQAKVHARLASVYFYLGKFDQAKHHATVGKNLATGASLSKLLARNLNLLSASYRGLAKQETDPKKARALFEQARALGEEALTIARSFQDHPYLKAKVLYTAGAAYAEDVTEDPSTAIKYYKEALSYLKDNTIDKQRTLIRLAHAELRKGHLEHAWKTLSPLFSKYLDERVRVHLYQIAAEIAFAEKNVLQAAIYTKNALRIAQALRLSADVEQLQILEKKISDEKRKGQP